MRALLVLFVSICCLMPAAAKAPPGYSEAEKHFQTLPGQERARLQILLAAVGYWNAMPQTVYRQKLFSEISRYQTERGWSSTGILTADQMSVLEEESRVLLDTWGFKGVPHSTRRKVIWVPMGLGMKAEAMSTGVMWTDYQKRVIVNYQYFNDASLAASYKAFVDNILNEGGTIHYKVLRPDFYTISASENGIDSYYRYHASGSGVLGFALLWQSSQTHLHMERVATIMSASLWSVMGNEPFPSLPLLAPARIAAQPAPNQPTAVSKPEENDEDDAKPEPKSSSGTGFFVSANGHLLTNAHVVDGCTSLRVTLPSRTATSAQVLAKDSANDLALLTTGLKPDNYAKFRTGVRLGEGVAAFGFPLSYVLASSGNFTLGNVTALSGIGDDSRFFQMSTPVQPGNSGGPLLDNSGSVVGVVASKLNALRVMVATKGDIPQNVNFAIKANAAANFMESNGMEPERGIAGESLEPADLADRAKAISVFIQCD